MKGNRVAFLVIAALLMFTIISSYAAEPTVTSSRISKNWFKHTWTSSTNIDSLLVGDGNGRPIEITDLPASSRSISVSFKTAETTASDVDKIIVWFYTNVNDAVVDLATQAEFNTDWVEAKRDTFTNDLQWVSTYDPDTYPARRVFALIYESAVNTADAEEAYVFVPWRGND